MATTFADHTKLSRWQSKQPSPVPRPSLKVDRWKLPLPGSHFPTLPLHRQGNNSNEPRPRPAVSVSSADANPTLPLRNVDEPLHLHAEPPRVTEAPSCSQRRVRFATFETSSPRHSCVEQIFFYPRVPAELFSQCFWSRKETNRFRSFQKDVAIYYKSLKGDEISKAILYLHGPVEKSEECKVEPEAWGMTEEGAIRALTENNTRGLEHFMSSAFHKHRALAMKRILAVQESCRNKDPEHVSILLRVWSLKVSAASKRYAYTIALGDERIVQADFSKAPIGDASAQADAALRTTGRNGEHTHYATCA